MFAFQTLGVMADAAEAIATDGDVSISHTIIVLHKSLLQIYTQWFPSLVHYCLFLCLVFDCLLNCRWWIC